MRKIFASSFVTGLLLLAGIAPAHAQNGRYTPDVPIAVAEADCAKNLGPACLASYVRYSMGNGVTANPAKAEFYAKRVCETGEPLGCSVYADYLEKNSKVASTAAGRADIIKYASMACDRGSTEGCSKVARLTGRAAAPAKTVPAVPTPKPAPPVSKSARCDNGDAFACESEAYDRGKESDWPMAAQFAQKGCDLGRASSCNAANIYQSNYRKFGDQSPLGRYTRRREIVDRATRSNSFASEISRELRDQRDLQTIADLILAAGPDVLRQLPYADMAAINRLNWGTQYYRKQRAWVTHEWSLRQYVPAEKKTFQGVGDNETGTATCYVNGRPGKRYQYKGFDNKMVYGPCTAD